MSNAPRIATLLIALCVAVPTMGHDKETAGPAEARFAFLDVNQDGVVSKYEYDSDVAFETMDGNHDKQLSAAELQSLMGGAQEDGATSASERIVIADLDRDGQLNEDELRRATEMRFTWLDHNRDGNLDVAELRSGFGVRVRP